MDNELLVKSIRKMCKANNITPSQLEAELGFGAGLISRWIKSSPSIDKIIDIADYFDVSIDELIGRNRDIIEDDNTSFIRFLIEMTNSKTLIWKYTKDMYVINRSYKYIADIDCNIKNFNDYPQTNRRIQSYTSEYKNGFITLTSTIIVEHNSIQQYDGHLFIQPDENTEPVYQKCNQEQLLNLFRTIERTFDEKIPEDLATDFKEELYNEQNIRNLQKFRKELSETNIPSVEDIDNIFHNEGVINVVAALDDPSIKSIVDTFTDPQMVKMIDSMKKMQSYMQKISNHRKKKTNSKRAGD